jgi:hypothetical protein
VGEVVDVAEELIGQRPVKFLPTSAIDCGVAAGPAK